MSLLSHLTTSNKALLIYNWNLINLVESRGWSWPSKRTIAEDRSKQWMHIENSWKNTPIGMLLDVLLAYIHMPIIRFEFFADVGLVFECRCGISFCYKCGKQVHQHWCRCDATSLCCEWCFRVCLLLIFLTFAFFFLTWETHGRGNSNPRWMLALEFEIHGASILYSFHKNGYIYSIL